MTQPDIVEQLRKLYDQFNVDQLDAATFGHRIFDVLSNHGGLEQLERLRAPSGVPSERAPPRNEVLEECARVADEAAEHERSEEQEARATLGKQHDHNSYGAGWSAGALGTAENIAEAIRSLAAPPAGQGGEKEEKEEGCPSGRGERSDEHLKAARLFIQDCMDTQHVPSGAIGNLMAARDEIDAALREADEK